MQEGAKALGAEFLEWEEGGDEAACLLERQTVWACLSSHAIVPF